MKSVRNILGVGLILVLMLVSCGHSRKLGTPLPGDSSATPPSTASSVQPRWLTDALAELDALQRPADVNPQIFADLKVRLALLLRDKASGKMASAISQNYTTALDLRFG